MRYATLVLTEAEGRIAPTLDRFERSESVSVESTRHMGPVTDGRYIGLVDVRGDLSEAERLLDAAEEVVGYDVTGADGTGVAYMRCRTAGLIGDLISILYAHDIVLDWPIEHREIDGSRGYRVSVIGTSSGIQSAVSELPGGVAVELEEIGAYRPDAGRLDGVLTDRQTELLELAVREGYYEVPRETTHRELASKLGVSAGTVGDRLQRIERRLVSAYAE